jgi:hypothetical protein
LDLLKVITGLFYDNEAHLCMLPFFLVILFYKAALDLGAEGAAGAFLAGCGAA